jgi:hypothetical protein
MEVKSSPHLVQGALAADEVGGVDAVGRRLAEDHDALKLTHYQIALLLDKSSAPNPKSSRTVGSKLVSVDYSAFSESLTLGVGYGRASCRYQ